MIDSPFASAAQHRPAAVQGRWRRVVEIAPGLTDAALGDERGECIVEPAFGHDPCAADLVGFETLAVRCGFVVRDDLCAQRVQRATGQPLSRDTTTVRPSRGSATGSSARSSDASAAWVRLRPRLNVSMSTSSCVSQLVQRHRRIVG